MMTTRLALGSVSTLALGALLLGATPYLLSRNIGPSHVAPWGAISSFSIGSSQAASANEDRARLLKLAALKTDDSAATPAPAPSSLPTHVAMTPPPEAAAVSESVADKSTAPELPAVQGDAAMESGQSDQVAAVEPETDFVKATNTGQARGFSSLININTASTDALDHLPGAGRIGHAIVTHRPYRAVNDLVRKRVLRVGDFQKIQSRIRVD